jgi:membrane protein YdbS with pleckstrin-like domain
MTHRRLAGMEPAPRLRDPRERVSPRARLMWMVGGLVWGVVFMTALLVGSLAFDWFELRWWMPVVLVLLTVVEAVAIPQWRYAVHRWEVTDTAVYTQTGWWRRERRIAPMSRIQTVDYVEGAVSRLFRLASVTATTASAAGALEIEGLDRDVARRLVDELTHKADAIQGDAT